MSQNFENLDQLSDKSMMSKLQEEKFDLALGEAFDLCYYGILEALDMKKYISVMPGGMYPASWLGIPSTPSFLPGSMLFVKLFKLTKLVMTTVPPPFSYLDRAKNFFSEALMNMFTFVVFGPIENVIKNFTRNDFSVVVNFFVKKWQFLRFFEKKSLNFFPKS